VPDGGNPGSWTDCLFQLSTDGDSNMRLTTTVILMIGALAVSAAPAPATPAEMARRAYAQGQARLAAADFEAALTAFKAAARADKENPEYRQQYALLRQVIRLEKRLPKEKNTERWLQGASALHNFYHAHGLYARCIPLDEKRYKRDPGAESAILLAETQLALGLNTRPAEILAQLPEDQQTPRTRALRGLALARDGRINEAKSLADDPRKIDAEAGPRHFYELARLLALIERPQDSLYALTQAIELTPPSQLEAFKDQVRGCTDLTALGKTNEFAEVMKLSSRVQESPCSGGTGCGKCPKRAKCGSAKTAHAKEKP
jgi:hypothetical protein